MLQRKSQNVMCPIEYIETMPPHVVQLNNFIVQYSVVQNCKLRCKERSEFLETFNKMPIREKNKIMMEAETVELDDVEAGGDKHSLCLVSRYKANWQLLAATQLFGESQKASEIVASFLDLAPLVKKKSWWPMEDLLVEQHKTVTKQIILDNLKYLVKHKIPDENGKVLLTISYDMGWQKCSRSYSSLSGHAFIINMDTGLVVGMRIFSKECQKCQKCSSHLRTAHPYTTVQKTTLVHQRGWKQHLP
jgi:hypothetical protein